MKRMCVAPLCIAVLLGRHAASAQENVSVKLDEFARTSNQQNSTLCQPVAQARRVGDQAEVQPASAGANDLRTAHDLEPQERAEVGAADSQLRPDSTSASQPPEKQVAAILEVGPNPPGVSAGADGLSTPPWRWK
jgi:hypothetical protein